MSPRGERFVRPDGRAKVSGDGQFTADLKIPRMLYGAFVWAGRAHARILNIDTSKALALSGVAAVVTAEDVPNVRYGAFVKDRDLFARDVVRFEGDVVAAVAATSLEIAMQARELIDVTFENLPAVFDPEAALAEDAPLVHADWEAYWSMDGVVRSRNDCARATTVKGDIERGLAEADFVLAERYVTDMSHAVPIEPHAIVARWEGDSVTIWSTSQVPFNARAGVAETLEMSEGKVRIVVPHLGGGFGGKCEFHFEAHVAALAKKAGRPVRVVFTREEEFRVTDKSRHGMVIELETGVARDGRITGRRARLVLDSGAYASDSPPLTEIATMLASGPYRIPNLEVDAQTPYTNKSPTGSVRAPTGPQMTWAVEQHTDELARRAGLTPYEFRMLNLVEEGDEGPTRQVFEDIGAKRCLERAQQLILESASNNDDEAVGLACGWWFSMPSPSGAFIKLNADGTGVIITGAQECGTGAVMALPLLAADVLGLTPEMFKVIYQDTDLGPWDVGSSGSQTTFNNGRAVWNAALEIKRQLLELASEELESDPKDLVLADGVVAVKRSPDRYIPVAKLAARAHEGELLLGHGSGKPPNLPAHDASRCVGHIAFGAFAAPTFFAQAVRARVDRATGVVSVLDVAAVHDFGRIVNAIGAEGQVEGGVVHGIGIALSEGTQFREGIQLNASLLDYKLTTCADAPPIHVEFVEAPASDGGPYGLKGAGEPPVMGAAGALGNAIANVIGARCYRLPMTPQRVWQTACAGAATREPVRETAHAGVTNA